MLDANLYTFPVEVYRSECREVLERFLKGRITASQCIAALDSTLAGVIPALDPKDLRTVQAIMEENYKILSEHTGAEGSMAARVN